MRPSVDLIVLSRADGPLPIEVNDGIACQQGVRLRVHRVIGRPEPTDLHRWQTIARARNRGKRIGTAPWVMFLDDDVVLAPGTVERLVNTLRDRTAYAAMAVDYLGESVEGVPTHHVAMGATLFRRSVLARVAFRWEAGRCECRCCCDDLRRLGYGIRYLPGIRAGHLGREATSHHTVDDASGDCVGATSSIAASIGGRVLAALDRRHVGKFQRIFLGSLRRAGNVEPVSVIGYGLYSSELAALRRSPGVEVLARPRSRTMPPIRRLQDFRAIVEPMPRDAPVAYWDAADVYFQGRLDGLWQLVRQNTDRLLAVREPRGFPQNPAIPAWCMSIRDRAWRERALELLKRNPFLNSGFAAGTARVMLQYLGEADRMRHSAELAGTRDWGDQMALNLYCHLDPQRWLEAPEGWNYCAHDRGRGEVRVGADGRITSRRGVPIHVVHGNAHSMRKLELYGH